MKRGRKSKIELQGKISDEEVKRLILDMSIKEDGTRMSYREIFSDSKFMELSGFWRRGLYNKKEKISDGSIDYNMRTKFKICEKDIFDYHQNVTKRIKCTEKFEDFIRKHKSFNNMSSYDAKLEFDKYETRQLIKLINKFFNEIEFDYFIHIEEPRYAVDSAIESCVIARYFNYGDFIKDFRKVVG